MARQRSAIWAGIELTARSGIDNSFREIDHAVTAGLTVLGAGAGALTGFLIGRGGGKRWLIYQTSQP
jgi:hypothetical protein